MQLIQWLSLVVVYLVNCNANANSGWPVADAEVLALHNAYRQTLLYGRFQSQPPAVDMPKLIWSHILANVSKKWVKTCQPYPSNITMRGRTPWTYVGQNVAVVRNARDAVALWFDEYSYYDFNSNKCRENKRCADYKQLVFAETTHVGCAYKRCDNFKAPKNMVVVCSYGPGGKYFSRRPYTASMDTRGEEDVYYDY